MNAKYAAITEQLIAQLERGCAPWVRPWSDPLLPTNLATKHRYRGVNILSLWMAQAMHEFPSAEWISFRQALALGGNVRKGERGTPIVFFTVAEREDEAAVDGIRRVPIMRGYSIFNRAQCDGLPSSEEEDQREPSARLADVDTFLGAIGATVIHGGDRACYSPGSDAINLPNFERFESPEHYYATSCHEHSHWTGAKHRLHREFGKRFGDAAYAAEELVAELTAAFLCGELGIPGQCRHPEYLASWVNVLRADARVLLTAGARASDSADYLAQLAGRRPAEEPIDEAEAA